jgi:1,4-dihydroxy-2-naphthoyl-CoA hydrolase
MEKTLMEEKDILSKLQSLNKGTMGEHLGIEYTAVGENYLEARMPVNEKSKQPMGLLHGGASVALAETLGSIAAYMRVNQETQQCVGLEINANHLKAVREGYVYGRATPIHIGKSTQVWEIRITSESGQLVCISRITMAVLDKK